MFDDSSQTQLEVSKKQICILLAFNCLSAMVQLVLDIYITTVVVDGQSCSSMFFADENYGLEQIFRLILSMLGYILPEWATIYVFYWMCRLDFQTNLDIPDMQDLSD
jgi:hypothetical protein